MYSMFVLNVRTMHSSALHALECIAWGRSSTGDSETGDAETSDSKTSESKREREREILPYLALVRSRDFDKQRTKSKLHKLMINHFF